MSNDLPRCSAFAVALEFRHERPPALAVAGGHPGLAQPLSVGYRCLSVSPSLLMRLAVAASPRLTTGCPPDTTPDELGYRKATLQRLTMQGSA